MADVYLTAQEYQQITGKLPASDFAVQELKARKFIDRLTDSRISRMRIVPDAVQLCMISLMSMEAKAGAEAQAVNPQVTSFTTDGYTETYGHAMTVADLERAMADVVSVALYGETDDDGTPLLYRGVS